MRRGSNYEGHEIHEGKGFRWLDIDSNFVLFVPFVVQNRIPTEANKGNEASLHHDSSINSWAVDFEFPFVSF